MDPKARKAAAVEFMELAASGRTSEAKKRLLKKGGVHHNPHFAAGWGPLLKAMDANHRRFPHKTLDVLRVVAEHELVVAHARVTHDATMPPVSLVHIFRFEGDRVAELWDIGQPIPPDSPNKDGAF